MYKLRSAAGRLSWSQSSIGLQEFSGAFGDMGTFLPLTLGLVAQIGLDLGTTLIFTGLYNISSGLMFGIPMGVQPMKTIASVALTEGLTVPEMVAAGMFVSATVLLLGATRLIEVVNKVIPSSIVRGIQLAVGTKLAMSGVQLALQHQRDGQLVWRPAGGTGSIWLGIVGLAFCAATLIPSSYQQQTGNQAPKAPRLNVTATPEPRPAQPPRRTASSQLLFMPEGPERPASSYLARDPVSYQNLMIVTGQLDYMDSTDGGTPGRSPGGLPADASPRSSAAGSPRGRQMLPSSTAAKDDASEADISDDLHGADSLHSDDMPGQQAAAGMCGACPPMPSTSGSLQQQVDCCSSTAQANAAPTALILLLLGILLTVTMDSSSLRGLSFGPQMPSIIVPTWAQLKAGILKAGIAQLPLTTLNSVIAVTALAKELFPTRDAARWSPTAVSIGVGAMNLVGCWFGAMPCCHGAGGLAAQHKFGARWGAAPVVLGCTKLLLGLLLGSSLFTLLRAFPQPLLGAMLTFSGIELACSASKEQGNRGWALLLLTAAAILSLGTMWGFVVGYGAYIMLLVSEEVHITGRVLVSRLRGRSSGRGDMCLKPTSVLAASPDPEQQQLIR